MGIIYMLLAISLVVAIIFFIAFIISVKNGQYDDSYTPSVRMLFEDELVKPTTSRDNDAHTEENEISRVNNKQIQQKKEKEQSGIKGASN